MVEQSNLILWGSQTARVLRAHWVLIELELPYKNRPIRTRTADMDEKTFISMAPQQKIPVLQDGELTLAESCAIVTYLAERYSTDKNRLIPLDQKQRAHYFQWISYASMELDATSLYVLRRHEDLTHIYGESEVANRTARDYFDRMIRAMAKQINGDGYLIGNQFTGADIIFTSCLLWAIRYRIELPDRFQRYFELTTARPAYRQAEKANNPPLQQKTK